MVYGVPGLGIRSKLQLWQHQILPTVLGWGMNLGPSAPARPSDPIAPLLELHMLGFYFILFFIFLPFLGWLPWHMEFPRLGVESEL